MQISHRTQKKTMIIMSTSYVFYRLAVDAFFVMPLTSSTRGLAQKFGVALGEPPQKWMSVRNDSWSSGGAENHHASSTLDETFSAGVAEIPHASSTLEGPPPICSLDGGDSHSGKYSSLRAQVYELLIK